MSALEDALAFQLKALGVTPPSPEYRFSAAYVGPGKGLRQRLAEKGLRDWRFDFAWPDLMFAVEVEGGGWTGGRHTRGKGFENDLTKYHHAMRLGWTVYRCAGHLIKSGEAAQLIEKIVKQQAPR